MRYFTKESLDYSAKLTFLLVVITLLLFYASNIIFPFLFALVFSFALLQPARWLEKIGLPRFLAALLLTVVGALIMVVIILFILFEGSQLIENLNQFAQSGELESMRTPVTWVENNFLDGATIQEDNLKMISGKLYSYAGGFFKSIFSRTTSTLVFLGIVPIYIVLILSYRRNFSEFLNQRLEKKGLKKGKEIIEEITVMVQRYLLGLLLIVFIVSILYGFGLYFIGIRYALFLAIFSAILITIPYVGSIIGAVMPVFIAWMTTDNWIAPLLVLSLYIFVQLLEGYVLTPLIVGKTVKLNPLAVIAGMIILGTLGGILAMVIAVPIIATVKILLTHSERFEATAILLGTELPDSNE